jgi:hypothetical protein
MNNEIIGALGDIHGRTIWKEIINKNPQITKWVFMGDYFDTHDDVTPEQQIENFLEIIEFKKANMDKVVLLIGNHDFHYTGYAYSTYSGYQYGAAPRIKEILLDVLSNELMQMCYKNDIYVFTHAGVTKTWAETNNIDLNDMENSINELFKTRPMVFDFTMGDNYSQTGNDITQTPIWVRPQALLTDAIEDIIYIVGHTTVSKLGLVKELPNLILIDCLGTTGEYLILENDIATAKKV